MAVNTKLTQKQRLIKRNFLIIRDGLRRLGEDDDFESEEDVKVCLAEIKDAVDYLEKIINKKEKVR